MSISSIYCSTACPIIGGIQINGSGFQLTDTITSTPDANILSRQFANSGQLLIAIGLDTSHASPGWFTFTVTTQNGVHSSSYSIPFFGDQNQLALSASGELNFLDQAQGLSPSGQNGFIRQYKPDGTPDPSIKIAPDNGIAVDDKTGDIVVSESSAALTLYIIGQGVTGNSNDSIGVAARNSYICATQPSVNGIGCLGVGQTNLPFTVLTMGSQPWSLAMGLFGTETDAFPLSIDGTPTLWKINVSGGMMITASQSIPGITPVSTLHASNFLAGGWHVAVFDKGPAANTAAVLSTADKSLTFLNTGSMTITKMVTLSGVPFRIAADMTNGNLIVAFADQAHMLTTFAAVNPTTGVVTPLTSTSALLAVGFAVSADGKNLYACQRAVCEVHPNQ